MRDLINLMESLAHSEASTMDAILENIDKAREGLREWRAKHHMTIAGMSHGEYDSHPINVVAKSLDAAAGALNDFLHMDPAVEHPERNGLKPDITVTHGIVVGNKHMVQANTSAGRTFMEQHFKHTQIATIGEIALQNLLKAAEFANVTVRHID